MPCDQCSLCTTLKKINNILKKSVVRSLKDIELWDVYNLAIAGNGKCFISK